MFFLTMGCFFYLGFCRYRAIHNREVRISFFQTYDKGEQPARLHVIGRHVQNHFEVPPLFHAAALMTYVTDSLNIFALVCAWLFVAGRVVHSCIHLGANNVSIRFFVFGFTLLCLTGMWLSLAMSLLSN